MGLDLNGVRFLLHARTIGVNFRKTAMIGRQCLDLSNQEIRRIFNDFGMEVNNQVAQQILAQNNGYAEPLFQKLGSEQVHSFDFSDYEGASEILDMNKSIPNTLKEQYSLVFDGGSLEHIFNFPVAIKNCMEMIKTGGHYLGISPANNFMGHGFYQFSPETYFSVFTKKNGFELVDLIAFEDRPDTIWYSVQNPVEVGERVTLINKTPVYLLIIAKKIAKKNIFEQLPQQSDYLDIWTDNDTSLALKSIKEKSRACANTLFAKARSIVPAALKRRLTRIIKNSRFGFNPRYFQPKLTGQKKRS